NEAISATSKKDVATDEDGNPDAKESANADEAQQGIDEAVSDGNEANAATAEGDTDAQTKLQDKISVKIAGGGLAAAGIVCTIKGMSDNIDQLRKDQVILPMIRMGMQAVSIGSQVQSNEDISSEQLGVAREDLHEKDKKGKEVSSWNQARSIQYELGQTQNGPDIPDSAKVFNKSNPLDFFDGIPGIGGICDAVESTVGQVLGFVLGGGPISAITSWLAGNFVLGPAIQSITSWLAGDAINPLATGAMRGNFINYGARLAANDQAVAAGGSALSGAQELALDQASRSVRQEEFDSKSFAYRMFNVNDSQTLVAKMIDSSNSNVSADVSSLTSNIGSVFASAPKVFATIFTQKVRAADGNYDYGFPAYGFSEEDQSNSEVENPYKNAARAAEILEGSDGQKYIDRAEKCFGVTISNTDGWDVNGGEDTADLYGDNYPGECSDTSSEWRTIRFFILDTQTMKSAACF
ncbi:hypothetical protein KC963_05415, partial [Candidatus Saccharibacteria bacterium]|nr:hypothetical protein [Candidatus Saccharibacteria bacterium]